MSLCKFIQGRQNCNILVFPAHVERIFKVKFTFINVFLRCECFSVIEIAFGHFEFNLY